MASCPNFMSPLCICNPEIRRFSPLIVAFWFACACQKRWHLSGGKFHLRSNNSSLQIILSSRCIGTFTPLPTLLRASCIARRVRFLACFLLAAHCCEHES